MTSGKRAKQRRRDAVVQTTTPRDPAAPNRVRELGAAHPLGEYAGAFAVWQGGMKARMLQMIEENKRALAKCDGTTGCQSSVHHPHCDAVR